MTSLSFSAWDSASRARARYSSFGDGMSAQTGLALAKSPSAYGNWHGFQTGPLPKMGSEPMRSDAPQVGAEAASESWNWGG
jgi:hypothetical protein